jgi:hypothetical protein
MMKIKVCLSLLLIGGTVTQAIGQKHTQNLEQIWGAYFNQTRFTNKWGMWLDVQLRTKEDFVKDFAQLLIRPGVIYYVNDNLRLTAGYAHFWFYPADNHSKVTQPEHRPWQQVQWVTKYNHNKTVQAVRLEERYRRKILNDSTLADGYSFNYRFRYNFSWQIPLSIQVKKGTWSAILGNEIFVNFGKQITYNYFDQNRLFVGLSYSTNATDNLQFGYMNIFQQLASGSNYRSTSIARVAYLHNLDLRNKKPIR